MLLQFTKVSPIVSHIHAPDGFRGREKEEKQLVGLLGGDSGEHAAISGVGGIGKSTLARQVASQLAGRYPGGVVTLELAGTTQEPLTSTDIMRLILNRLAPDAMTLDDADELNAVYTLVLAKQPTLLILDNARDSAQVFNLLPAEPSAAIITCRLEIDLNAVTTVQLDILEADAARDLLRGVIARDEVSEVDLDAVAKACGYVPLTLHLAGAFLAMDGSLSAVEYLDALAQEKRRHDVPAPDLNAVAALSLSRLEQDDTVLAGRWPMLGVFPYDFDEAAAAAVWGGEATDGLANLVNRSMLVHDKQTNRYRLHDPMRNVALSHFKESRTKNNPRMRFARHYLKVLEAANKKFLQGGDGVLDGLATYDVEQRNIESGHASAAANWEISESIVRLSNKYSEAGVQILNHRLPTRDRIFWLETALGAARYLGFEAAESAHLGDLGVAHENLGDTEKAMEYYTQGLEHSRSHEDRPGERDILGKLGDFYYQLGDLAKAIEHFELALPIAREVKEREEEVLEMLNRERDDSAGPGSSERAIGYYEQRLETVRALYTE